MLEKDKKIVLVLFSGGRDSSATVIEMIRAGYKVKLFTYLEFPGIVGPNGDSPSSIRYKELLNAFPKYIDSDRVIKINAYLVRKLAIEKTNKIHVVYPITLALAIHVDAILYCLENNIKDIASGNSGYQAKEDRYIEQQNNYCELMKDFLAEYNITYHTPIAKKSKKEIVDVLEQCSISSNSLEGNSIFGAIPFEIDKALDFWNESIPVCREYIKNMRSPKI
ncbi:MAG: hypothetical protein WCC74_01795 [Minisyncoccia bacterium]